MANQKTDDGKKAKGVFADTMNDIGMKIVFGSEENMLLLINAYLGEGFATKVTFTNKEMLTDLVKGKRSALDMRCTTSNGEEVLVEVQVKKYDNFAERLLFYSSHIVLGQFQAYKDKELKERYLQRTDLEEIKKEGRHTPCSTPKSTTNTSAGSLTRWSPYT